MTTDKIYSPQFSSAFFVGSVAPEAPSSFFWQGFASFGSFDLCGK